LVAAARQRGVTLVVMPPGMTRRIGNTSRYDAKADVLHWRLHCVFVASSAPFAPSQLLSNQLECTHEGGLTSLEGGLVGMCMAAVRDCTLVGDLLSAFLDAGSVAGSPPCTAAQAHALRYLRLSRAGVKAYVQWIPSPAHSPLFAEVSLESSLRGALEGKTVVEHPRVTFARREDAAGLRLRVVEVAPEQEQACAESSGNESNSDSDDGTDFMQALQEMGGKDVSALRSIIDGADGAVH